LCLRRLVPVTIMSVSVRRGRAYRPRFGGS
jgi:hypothetical protein